MEMKLLVLVFTSICLIAQPGWGQDFQLLVFGGFKERKQVQFFPSLDLDQSCKLPSLPEQAHFKPFGGFMEGNITVCGGKMENCYNLGKQSGNLKWSQSFKYDHYLSSLITTYDMNSWSTFGGKHEVNAMLQWTTGSDSFKKYDLGQEVHYGACSSRKNQTHAIISLGSNNVYWYAEQGLHLEKWEGEETDVVHYNAGCGTTFHPDLGYQFVTAGGSKKGFPPLDATERFVFDENVWVEGPTLLGPRSRAASVPYQNGFLLVGGKEFKELEEGFYNDILQYDPQNGWIQLNIRLKYPDINVGSMRMPKGKLQCPE